MPGPGSLHTVANRRCSTSMRSRGVTQGLAGCFLPVPRTELWPVASDTRQHASSFNPLPDPGAPKRILAGSPLLFSRTRGILRAPVRTAAPGTVFLPRCCSSTLWSPPPPSPAALNPAAGVASCSEHRSSIGIFRGSFVRRFPTRQLSDKLFDGCDAFNGRFVSFIGTVRKGILIDCDSNQRNIWVL